MLGLGGWRVVTAVVSARFLRFLLFTFGSKFQLALIFLMPLKLLPILNLSVFILQMEPHGVANHLIPYPINYEQQCSYTHTKSSKNFVRDQSNSKYIKPIYS